MPQYAGQTAVGRNPDPPPFGEPAPTEQQLRRSRRLILSMAIVTLVLGLGLLVPALLTTSAILFGAALTGIMSGIVLFAVLPFVTRGRSAGPWAVAIGLALVCAVMAFVTFVPGPLAAASTADPEHTAEASLDPHSTWTTGEGQDTLLHGTSETRFLSYDSTGSTLRGIDIADTDTVTTTPDGEIALVAGENTTTAYDWQGDELGTVEGRALAVGKSTLVVERCDGACWITGYDRELRTEIWVTDEDLIVQDAQGPYSQAGLHPDDRESVRGLGALPGIVLADPLDDGTHVIDADTGQVEAIEEFSGSVSVEALGSRSALVHAEGGGHWVVSVREDGTRSVDPVDDLPFDASAQAIGDTYLAMSSGTDLHALDGAKWHEIPVAQSDLESRGDSTARAAWVADGATLVTSSGAHVAAYDLTAAGVPVVWERDDLRCRGGQTEMLSIAQDSVAISCDFRNPIPLTLDTSGRVFVLDTGTGTTGYSIRVPRARHSTVQSVGGSVFVGTSPRPGEVKPMDVYR